MPIEKIREALGPDAARHVENETHRQNRDLGIPTPTTHVIVGDHQPEPRVLGQRTGSDAPVNLYEGVIGRPGGRTRKDGGYGASFDD